MDEHSVRPTARARLERWLTTLWAGRGSMARLLWPLSLLHGAVLAGRRLAYRSGALRSEHLPVPVVVVGNVVAGGAGKTPTTIALAAQLQAAGWHPGIISRGHGRRGQVALEVQPGAAPERVGDEPLLLRHRTGVPVAVAARRAEAGRLLLAGHPGIDILLCDDGLQHLALARDLEICVFDARGTGNGWLLPAGPLRERWPRPAHLVLLTERVPDGALAIPAGTPVFQAERRLAAEAVRADGARIGLERLQGQPLVAIAGIARPPAFFDMLRAAGLQLQRCIALPDHHDYADAGTWLELPQHLVCTEKDAVKLWRHRPDAWAVPLELSVPPEFTTALLKRLALAPAAGADRRPD